MAAFADRTVQSMAGLAAIGVKGAAKALKKDQVPKDGCVACVAIGPGVLYSVQY